MGICSKTREQGYHWLLLDFDERFDMDALFCFIKEKFNKTPIVAYRTPHGLHICIFAKHSFMETARLMLEFPIDLQWFIIGFRRGYWFLETHSPFYFGSIKDDMIFERIERNA